jgi:hypothetical protein
LKIPGGSAGVSINAETMSDTVWGSGFGSVQTGLISWDLNASGYYKGIAGWQCTIKKSGTATSFTDEATSLISGKIYQIDDTTKRILDWDTAIVIKDDGVAVDSDNYTINHMHGKVTFIDSYTVNGAITFASGKYLPVSAYGWSNEVTLGMTSGTNDATTFDVAQANGGYMAYDQGLKEVNLALGSFFQASNGLFSDLEARTAFVIEICPDGNSKSIGRGIFIITGTDQDGEVGGQESQSGAYQLFTPADVDHPFSWHHETDTTLDDAIVAILTAWENKSDIWIKYLVDGVNGYQGKAVVTDCSLATGLSDMNTFTTNFQGNEEVTELNVSS